MAARCALVGACACAAVATKTNSNAEAIVAHLIASTMGQVLVLSLAPSPQAMIWNEQVFKNSGVASFAAFHHTSRRMCSPKSEDFQ
jgi:hypothetical protein